VTALAEALLAAQRQAIGALAKPYIADVIGVEQVTARLGECDALQKAADRA
jgi:hypothetical protein